MSTRGDELRSGEAEKQNQKLQRDADKKSKSEHNTSALTALASPSVTKVSAPKPLERQYFLWFYGYTDFLYKTSRAENYLTRLKEEVTAQAKTVPDKNRISGLEAGKLQRLEIILAPIFSELPTTEDTLSLHQAMTAAFYSLPETDWEQVKNTILKDIDKDVYPLFTLRHIVSLCETFKQTQKQSPRALAITHLEQRRDCLQRLQDVLSSFNDEHFLKDEVHQAFITAFSDVAEEDWIELRDSTRRGNYLNRQPLLVLDHILCLSRVFQESHGKSEQTKASLRDPAMKNLEKTTQQKEQEQALVQGLRRLSALSDQDFAVLHSLLSPIFYLLDQVSEKNDCHRLSIIEDFLSLPATDWPIVSQAMCDSLYPAIEAGFVVARSAGLKTVFQQSVNQDGSINQKIRTDYIQSMIQDKNQTLIKRGLQSIQAAVETRKMAEIARQMPGRFLWGSFSRPIPPFTIPWLVSNRTGRDYSEWGHFPFNPYFQVPWWLHTQTGIDRLDGLSDSALEKLKSHIFPIFQLSWQAGFAMDPESWSLIIKSFTDLPPKDYGALKEAILRYHTTGMGAGLIAFSAGIFGSLLFREGTSRLRVQMLEQIDRINSIFTQQKEPLHFNREIVHDLHETEKRLQAHSIPEPALVEELSEARHELAREKRIQLNKERLHALNLFGCFPPEVRTDILNKMTCPPTLGDLNSQVLSGLRINFLMQAGLRRADYQHVPQSSGTLEWEVLEISKKMLGVDFLLRQFEHKKGTGPESKAVQETQKIKLAETNSNGASASTQSSTSSENSLAADVGVERKYAEDSPSSSTESSGLGDEHWILTGGASNTSVYPASMRASLNTQASQANTSLVFRGPSSVAAPNPATWITSHRFSTNPAPKKRRDSV